MKQIITRSVATCFTLIVGCAPSIVGKRAASAPMPRARFEVHIADLVSGSGRDREDLIEMTLTNESDRVLWVNPRMNLAPRGGEPPGVVEVGFEITGPSGKLPYPCHRRIGRPWGTSYVALKPREQLTGHSSMWCPGLLDEPGVYTARAAYHDENPEAPVPPPGAEHLSEEVVAEPVQFRVLPK